MRKQLTQQDECYTPKYLVEYFGEYDTLQEYKKALKEKCDAFDKAIEYIENHKLDFKQGTTTFGSERLSMEERKLLDILRGE